jgi:hypothetical protein
LLVVRGKSGFTADRKDHGPRRGVDVFRMQRPDLGGPQGTRCCNVAVHHHAFVIICLLTMLFFFAIV